MEQGFEYYAFISYKSEDEKWAKWLQRKIEHYRLPAIIRKSNADIPNKVRPVFFAKSDIQPGPLESGLQWDLERSKYLIVICSPRSANSNWVGKEIQYFISLGKADKVILFAIDGIPYSDDPETECIHPVIKKELPELYAVNINEEGNEWRYTKKERAFIQVLSKILNVSFDTLWQRHRRRRIKQVVLIAVFAFFMLTGTMAIWRYNLPFDVQLSLQEKSIHNENLGFPVEDGTVYIVYNHKDTINRPVRGLAEIVRFNDIPGRYLGSKSNVFFRLWGFNTVDTVMELNRVMVLPICRDETYSTVKGYVRDARTDLFVGGATVEIANQTATTDKNGYFTLTVPLERQRKAYEAILVSNGKKQEKQIVYPTQKEESLINTLYIK